MEDVSALQRNARTPGEEVPDFSGTHRVLQCCTLSSVISHKAGLNLHQEQLRGLWSEIKRRTIHFLYISSLIIHLNCSERLRKAKCQGRWWVRMCTLACVWSQGSVVWWQSRAQNREVLHTQHEHPRGNQWSSGPVRGGTELYCALSCCKTIRFEVRSDSQLSPSHS